VAFTVDATGVQSVGTSQPRTMSYTTTSDCKVVVLCVVGIDNNTELQGGTVTYGGQTMTKLHPALQLGGPGFETAVGIWYLIEPPTGSYSFSYPNAGDNTIRLYGIGFRCASGYLPAIDDQDYLENSSGGANPALPSMTASGAWAGVAVMGNGYRNDASADSHTTIGTLNDEGSCNSGAQYGIGSSSGSVVFSWTQNSDDYALEGLLLKEVEDTGEDHPLSGTISATAALTTTPLVVDRELAGSVSGTSSLGTTNLRHTYLSVEREEDGGGFSEIAHTDNDGAWTDTDTFSNGVEYNYRIRYYNDGTWGEYSNEDSVVYVSAGEDHPLAGTIAATAALAGTAPDLDRKLAGSISATGALVGTAPDLDRKLAGSISAVSTLAGALTRDTALAGIVTAAATLAGAVTKDSKLAGSVSATGALVGNMVRGRPLAGLITATAAMAGNIGVARILSGSVDATATLAGLLDVNHPLVGSISATGALAGTAPDIDRKLAGSIDATGAMSGSMLVGQIYVGATVAEAEVCPSSTQLVVYTGSTVAEAEECLVGVPQAGQSYLGSTVAEAEAVPYGSPVVDVTGYSCAEAEAVLAGSTNVHHYYSGATVAEAEECLAGVAYVSEVYIGSTCAEAEACNAGALDYSSAGSATAEAEQANAASVVASSSGSTTEESEVCPSSTQLTIFTGSTCAEAEQINVGTPVEEAGETWEAELHEEAEQCNAGALAYVYSGSTCSEAEAVLSPNVSIVFAGAITYEAEQCNNVFLTNTVLGSLVSEAEAVLSASVVFGLAGYTATESEVVLYGDLLFVYGGDDCEENERCLYHVVYEGQETIFVTDRREIIVPDRPEFIRVNSLRDTVHTRLR